MMSAANNNNAGAVVPLPGLQGADRPPPQPDGPHLPPFCRAAAEPCTQVGGAGSVSRSAGLRVGFGGAGEPGTNPRIIVVAMLFRTIRPVRPVLLLRPLLPLPTNAGAATAPVRQINPADPADPSGRFPPTHAAAASTSPSVRPTLGRCCSLSSLHCTGRSGRSSGLHPARLPRPAPARAIRPVRPVLPLRPLLPLPAEMGAPA